MDQREENKLKQKAQEYYEKEFSYNQVYIQGYSDGYAKAIDEFAKRLKSESYNGYATLENYCEDTIESVVVENIVRIAEQMKKEV